MQINVKITEFETDSGFGRYVASLEMQGGNMIIRNGQFVSCNGHSAQECSAKLVPIAIKEGFTIKKIYVEKFQNFNQYGWNVWD